MDRIIQEYINNARPISSQLIERKYKLGVSPATVRIEMQRLSDSGYLFQPHTSAGRVPTDKGYRFFVDRLLDKEISKILELFEVKDVLEREKDIFKQIISLTRFLSKSSSAFVVSYISEDNLFFKEGWEEIMKEPEFSDKDLVSEFTKLLENMEKGIQDLKLNSSVKVYIGNESPLKKSKDFSVILSKCRFPKKEGVISIMGPKRMPYQKNISLISSLTKLLENY